MNIFRNFVPLKSNSRSFWGALNVIFNRVSKSRIKEVGPDRACAEWLMRNGAFVKWKGSPSHVTHYNFLPLDPEDKGQYYIEEVLATEASISHHGFEHFKGCDYITTMKFEKCYYFNDSCLEQLRLVTKSLLYLDIKQCQEITDEGLLHIKSLSNLRILKLGDLSGVQNMQECVKKINSELPNCQIMPA